MYKQTAEEEVQGHDRPRDKSPVFRQPEIFVAWFKKETIFSFILVLNLTDLFVFFFTIDFQSFWGFLVTWLSCLFGEGLLDLLFSVETLPFIIIIMTCHIAYLFLKSFHDDRDWVLFNALSYFKSFQAPLHFLPDLFWLYLLLIGQHQASFSAIIFFSCYVSCPPPFYRLINFVAFHLVCFLIHVDVFLSFSFIIPRTAFFYWSLSLFLICFQTIADIITWISQLTINIYYTLHMLFLLVRWFSLKPYFY